MKGEMMPIKDQQARREYFQTYMANRRKGLTSPNVKPVKPEPALLNPDLVVKPTQNNPVKPEVVKPNPTLNPAENVKPLETVKPCQLNHYSLTELFQQATVKIRQDYQAIYQDPETSRKCFNCHNLQRNYQIMLSLLEKYWAKAKRLTKEEKSM